MGHSESRVTVPPGRQQERQALRAYAATYEPRGGPALTSWSPAGLRSTPGTARNESASAAPSVPPSPRIVVQREYELWRRRRCPAHTASAAAGSVAAAGTAASRRDSLWPECLSSAPSEPRSG